eukprot:scaffold2679_cov251-Pinguiococcus_pyrenoidosus.AAC.12
MAQAPAICSAVQMCIPHFSGTITSTSNGCHAKGSRRASDARFQPRSDGRPVIFGERRISCTGTQYLLGKLLGADPSTAA